MLQLEHISHSYEDEKILHDINLSIETGSFNIITGESGSGKSTLLSIVSTLLKPTEGEIYYNDVSSKEIPDINRFRNQKVGFIFQFHYLISHLNVYENIAMVTKRPKLEIEVLLDQLDIGHLQGKYPDQISGGQRQRAAIARAMINQPEFIFADEPTGNLDSKNSEIVFELLRGMAATVVVATHDHSRIQPGDRIISLKDGRLC
ncbi:ABC transporter ATP-binding protein [Sulfurovum sp. zt1-1]|uniref:ABC transporter ATP-binding protein n=1 Tax=Sulfurovum zhangzhouensis TaxID=3019067 RepID=A0ABT7QXN7_9BACT|nr:ABC transporter ATP-binding protein [Sulfurovum zhangzhouensis]MDM5271590.1 ABC transporter ATP-binding protein [Sulfurovum zhangzhouensis]